MPQFRNMTPEEKKRFGGKTPIEIAGNPNSPYYASAKQEYESLMSDIEKQGMKFSDLGGVVGESDLANANVNRDLFGSEPNKRIKLTSHRGTVGVFEIGAGFDWETERDQYNTSDAKGGATDLMYAKQRPDGSFEEMKKFDDAENKTIKEAIDSLKGPAVVLNTDGVTYAMYKDINGKSYYLNAWDPIVKKWNDPGFAQLSSNIWQLPHAKTFLKDGTVSSMEDYMNGFVRGAYASGTLSSPGGRSLINENGLESIITPSGTITSLPAKSGIVPADLTRNLWTLGEVAPNLIARLGGNNLQTNNSNSSTDNSINIQNLDATFNTQSDFDGHRFLTDLRNQVILTANNH